MALLVDCTIDQSRLVKLQEQELPPPTSSQTPRVRAAAASSIEKSCGLLERDCPNQYGGCMHCPYCMTSKFCLDCQ